MPEVRIPKLSHHKASGQAVVRLSGKDFYVGPWNTQVARNEYDRLVGEWLAGGRKMPAVTIAATTLAEIMAAFWVHAEGYYRYFDGTPAKEIASFRDSLRPLRRLDGQTPAEEFGPLALKAVRQAMINDGLCPSNINQRIGRIKHMFKWTVENELVSANVFHGL
jgi:hypothetical protein